MIKSGDISVVVQGAADFIQTPRCLKSIRKHLPEAEIILSCWENELVKNMDCDILLLNKDPGAILIDGYKSKTIYNNLNRQLFSTQEGLKKATRKYVLKLRSDSIISNTSFLENFDKYPKRTEEYRLFKHKILASVLLTRYYYQAGNIRIKMPFHISDWWFFGLNEDVKKYFLNTPLVEEPDFTKYFEKSENKAKNNPYGKVKHKFAPEQYFALSAFSNEFKDLQMADASDYSEELMEKFKKCIVNNFILLEFKESGIYLSKYGFSKNEKYIGEQYINLYNSYRYQKDYKEICDNNFKITAKTVLEDKITYAKMKIYKHIYRMCEPKINVSKKVESIFLGFPFAVLKYLTEVITSGIFNNKLFKHIRKNKKSCTQSNT